MKKTMMNMFALAMTAMLLFALAPLAPALAADGEPAVGDPAATQPQPDVPGSDPGNDVNNGQETEDGSADPEGKPSEPVDEKAPASSKVKLEAAVNVNHEQRSAKVTAKALDTGNLESGSFTMMLDGTNGRVTGTGEFTAEGTFEDLAVGDHFVKVKFAGKTNEGKTVAGTRTLFFQVEPLPGEDTLSISHRLVSDNGRLIIYGEIPNAENAHGTWVFTFNGQKAVYRDVDGVRQQAGEGFGGEDGKRYVATVEFRGEVEGKHLLLRSSQQVILVGMDRKTSCTEKGLRVDGWLTGTRQAEGEWTVTYSDLKGKVGKHFSDTLKGTRYSHTFPKGQLKPGYYEIYVGFDGQTNGVPTSLGIMDGIELKKGDPCLGTGGKPGDGGKPDDGKPGTPDRGDSPADDVENGGNLPGTSISYPTFTLIGAGVLLLGAVLTLLLRRARNRK